MTIFIGALIGFLGTLSIRMFFAFVSPSPPQIWPLGFFIGGILGGMFGGFIASFRLFFYPELVQNLPSTVNEFEKSLTSIQSILPSNIYKLGRYLVDYSYQDGYFYLAIGFFVILLLDMLGHHPIFPWLYFIWFILLCTVILDHLISLFLPKLLFT